MTKKTPAKTKSYSASSLFMELSFKSYDKKNKRGEEEIELLKKLKNKVGGNREREEIT